MQRTEVAKCVVQVLAWTRLKNACPAGMAEETFHRPGGDTEKREPLYPAVNAC